MKWFKHFSNAKFDAKIRRLIKKYGLRGYGLYFAMIEYAAHQLTTEKPVPDIEENSQDIADTFNEDTLLVEEIILFCINEHLFDQDENTGRIMCLKLLCHLDNTMSTNPEIRKILNNFNKLKETSSSLKKLSETSNHLKQTRLDKTRLDKIKEEKSSKIEYSPFVFMTEDEYNKLITKYGESQVKLLIEELNNYKGEKGKKYKSDYHAILKWVVKACGVIEIENSNQICNVCNKKYSYSPEKNICCDCLKDQSDKEKREEEKKGECPF